jgi:hypothetical protein
MKIIRTTIVILVSLHSMAHAQSGSRQSDDGKDWSWRGQHFTARLMGPRTSNGIVDNPNKCAPDRSEAVWSATSAVVGYACVSSGSGG